MPPHIVVTIDSAQLGLEPGGLAELDACVSQFPREQIILRTIAVLHAMAADRYRGSQALNETLARAASGDIQRRLTIALQQENSSFLEPLQQLLVLRRAMTVCTETGTLDLTSDAPMRAYLDACRFAADITSTQMTDTAIRVEQWIQIAANFSPRLWLTNPVNPNHWIARMRLMLDRLPEAIAALRPYADALKQRFPEAIGLSYVDVSTLVAFMGYWTMGLDPGQIFQDYNRVRLDPSTWLSQTDIPLERLMALLSKDRARLGPPP